MDIREIIPFRYRLWSWIWKGTQQGNRTIYEKYMVLWYIDSRDAQERLDKLFWMDRSDEYKEIKWNLFCGVTIKGNTRWDCGTESNTEKDKWEASDAFKRACVKWWLWRFLYTLPTIIVTDQEAKDHKYDLTEYVKSKNHDKLKKWMEEYNKSLEIEKK